MLFTLPAPGRPLGSRAPHPPEARICVEQLRHVGCRGFRALFTHAGKGGTAMVGNPVGGIERGPGCAGRPSDARKAPQEDHRQGRAPARDRAAKTSAATVRKQW